MGLVPETVTALCYSANERVALLIRVDTYTSDTPVSLWLIRSSVNPSSSYPMYQSLYG